MPRIQFPTVPNVQGVPTLARQAGVTVGQRVALGAIQGAIWNVLQSRLSWGVLDSEGRHLADPRKFQDIIGVALGTFGGAVLSTNAVEYRKEHRVSDFPVEGGGFATYNKVELPSEPTVTLCFGGTESDRSNFLSAIDAACKSLDLYTVSTPEASYTNHNIVSYDYQRTSTSGANLLLVRLTLKEIRQVSAQYVQSNKNAQIGTPKDVGSAQKTDGGKIQPVTPKTSVIKSLTDKLQARLGGS